MSSLKSDQQDGRDTHIVSQNYGDIMNSMTELQQTLDNSLQAITQAETNMRNNISQLQQLVNQTISNLETGLNIKEIQDKFGQMQDALIKEMRSTEFHQALQEPFSGKGFQKQQSGTKVRQLIEQNNAMKKQKEQRDASYNYNEAVKTISDPGSQYNDYSKLQEDTRKLEETRQDIQNQIQKLKKVVENKDKQYFPAEVQSAKKRIDIFKEQLSRTENKLSSMFIDRPPAGFEEFKSKAKHDSESDDDQSYSLKIEPSMQQMSGGRQKEGLLFREFVKTKLSQQM